jgi:NADH-quinone oxidoreductase subunit M
MTNYLPTILLFLPVAGAILVLFARDRNAIRWTALGTTLAAFLLSLIVAFNFADTGSPQMVLDSVWIPAFNVHYKVGIDGLSLPLVLLTTFISVLACVASWNIPKMIKGYMALFLFLETGLLGVFLSLDFFLFYVFFEITLLPMYFLIGIWGGTRKEYAAIKFFLYTLCGSVVLLVALIATYLYSRQVPGYPNGTFDLITLASPSFQAKFIPLIGGAAGMAAKWMFVLVMIAFLIKVPAVPLHTWLPDAHVEAPTPISMVLASLLLKMGGYGIFRVAYPLFPGAAKALWMPFAIIGVISILYGALCALSQKDFKRLVAYSSVSHMGLVVLGAAMMTPAGMNGALFMMVAHGITSAMLFFIVGVIYDRAHHREIARFGGLATTMPLYTGLSSIAFFANLGLPGLCGFVGEVLVVLGSFQAARSGSVLIQSGYATPRQIYPLAIMACFGVILTAGYMLWTIQRIFFGPEKSEYKDFPEMDQRELIVMTPLVVMAILLGILPTLFVFAFSSSTLAAMFKLF